MKEQIELDVVARCYVSRLRDGRVAVMHETLKGEACPMLFALVEGCAESDELQQAVLDCLQLDTDAEIHEPKKRSLKKDKDAKEAILQFLFDVNAPLEQGDIGSHFGFRTQRLDRLLRELFEENKAQQVGQGWMHIEQVPL